MSTRCIYAIPKCRFLVLHCERVKSSHGVIFVELASCNFNEMPNERVFVWNMHSQAAYIRCWPLCCWPLTVDAFDSFVSITHPIWNLNLITISYPNHRIHSYLCLEISFLLLVWHAAQCPLNFVQNRHRSNCYNKKSPWNLVRVSMNYWSYISLFVSFSFLQMIGQIHIDNPII